MKVCVDATKCSGYGACADVCPSLFKIDEFGFAQIIGDGTVPPAEEGKVASAAQACPDHAIIVENESE